MGPVLPQRRTVPGPVLPLRSLSSARLVPIRRGFQEEVVLGESARAKSQSLHAELFEDQFEVMAMHPSP